MVFRTHTHTHTHARARAREFKKGVRNLTKSLLCVWPYNKGTVPSSNSLCVAGTIRLRTNTVREGINWINIYFFKFLSLHRAF
jgi:hypothetical protein